MNKAVLALTLVVAVVTLGVLLYRGATRDDKDGE